MNELQRFLVADRIGELERDAEGLRAARLVSGRRTGIGARRSNGARGRIGALLVALGEAIAGPSTASAAHDGGRHGARHAIAATPARRLVTRSTAVPAQPCTDDAGSLRHAA